MIEILKKYETIIKGAFKIMGYLTTLFLVIGGGIFLFNNVSCKTFFPESKVENLTKKEASKSSQLAACFRIMESGKAGANVVFCQGLMRDNTIQGKLNNYFDCISKNNDLKDEADKLNCKVIVFPEYYALNAKGKLDIDE